MDFAFRATERPGHSTRIIRCLSKSRFHNAAGSRVNTEAASPGATSQSPRAISPASWPGPQPA